MTRDFQKIQMVRRLIRDKRYDEARLLLKEMQHPQVPVLEEQLTKIIEHQRQLNAGRKAVLSKAVFVFGFVVGLALAGINIAAGVHNLPFLVLNFGIGFAIGCILPEHERRRQASRDALMAILNKRRSKYH